ncbi:MAG: flagellar biosynthetic protein FliQ [Synergistaceae bacterium]|jgi:flagellar biosynthetic protein FliQ|nr:flagellar biosynthetic protein FliQ [Synergistaceae bacterium]
METLTVGDAFVSAMWTMVFASMPVLLISMCVGLIMGIFQTATSIQEQALTFIPKMLAIIIALLLFGPWMFRMVGGLAIRLFTDMYKYVG